MPRLSYSLVREKLAARGLFPETRLGRVACYLAGIDLLFYLLQKLFAVLSVLPGTVATLSAWEEPLLFVVVVLGMILALKWVRLHLMWRLRNRLIVTYVFIGVIPVVLLVSMALIAGWLFVGQFATFVVSDDLSKELNKVATGNAVVTAQIASDLGKGTPAAALATELGAAARAQEISPEITFFYKGQRTDVNPPADAAGPAEAPGWLGPAYRGVVYADDRLWLRVAQRTEVKGQPLTVISSAALNKPLLERVAGELGEITLDLSSLRFNEPGQQGNLVFHAGAEKPKADANTQVIEISPTALERANRRALIGGRLPQQQSRWDRGVVFGTPLAVDRWADGRDGRLVLSVQTRLSLLYRRLFLTLGDFSRIIVQVLIGIAIFFALLELFALFIGVRLTRSMTRSVAELYKATEHINRGQFRHRIQVRSYDQLAALEKSFNSLAESIERLLAEQQEKQRIENELAIAQ